jgi:8-oxo-dGTP pyrophosphatase MutT (NUDIX family)
VTPCVTAGGRPAFVVNVEVFLHRDGRWLLIKRGDSESQAPGALAGVGGKVDAPICDAADIIEATARREVREELGVDLGDVAFGYAESAFFVTDDGDPVVNITLTAPLPAEATPFPAAADEVAGIAWLTLDEALADPRCPPWTRRSLGRAAALW